MELKTYIFTFYDRRKTQIAVLEKLKQLQSTR